MKSLRPFLVGSLLGLAFTTVAANDPLETGFLNPPDSAKPQTWWHWMNGNITKAGITADSGGRAQRRRALRRLLGRVKCR